MSTINQITKSIRLTLEESHTLAHISMQQGQSEASILKRFVRDGIAQYQLEEAISAYERGEADISAAARHAGVSVYHFMTRLEERDITPPLATQKFVQGLRTLVEAFGGSDALKKTIAEIEIA